jgi:hypothetical protein
MPVTSRIIGSRVGVFFFAAAHAGESTPLEDLQPMPLPSLEQRVRDAGMIVRLRIETRKHEAVGRIGGAQRQLRS